MIVIGKNCPVRPRCRGRFVLVALVMGGCATLPGPLRQSDACYTTGVERFVWSAKELSKPALDKALRNFKPSKYRKAGAPITKENRAAELEYAMEYAIEYALQCTLDDIMQAPPDEVLERLPAYPMKDVFTEAFEVSLVYVLEDNLRDFSRSDVLEARSLAFGFARARALQEAVAYALADVTNPALRDRLNEQLAAALEEAMAGAFETTLAKATSSIPSIWPVEHPDRYVSSLFGAVRRSLGGAGRLHKGVDIVAPRGIPVYAAATGVVEYAGRGSGYGLLVRIKHANGYGTLYAHLASYCVKEGDEVECGQEIGKLGATGNARCPHVHYEVHHNDSLVDPERFLPEE